MVIKMIYACEHCRFVFERVGPVESCPDCGKPVVREATDAEKAEYQKNRAMRGSDPEKPDIRDENRPVAQGSGTRPQ
jgi:uncharacterized Zn finger protein (UPF0148 family)